MRNAGGNLSKQETLRPPPGLQPGKKPDTCTTNRITARIPLPPLRGPPSPRGKVFCRWLGGGTYLYRKSDYCPHSSSGTSCHLPPGGRAGTYCFLLFGLRWFRSVLAGASSRPTLSTVNCQLSTVHCPLSTVSCPLPGKFPGTFPPPGTVPFLRPGGLYPKGYRFLCR